MKRIQYAFLTGAVICGIFANSFTILGEAVPDSAVGIHSTEPVPYVKTLTIEQAVTMAIENSNAWKKLLDNDTYYKERAQDIEDTYIDSNSLTRGIDYQTDLADLANQRRANEDNKQKELDSIELNVNNNFISILKAELSYAEFMETLKLEESKFAITELRYEHGMISKNDFEAASEELDTLAAKKTDYQKVIKDASQALDRLIGVDLNNRYQLIMDIQYKELEIKDINVYINELIKTDSSLKQYQYELEANQYTKETYSDKYKDSITNEVITGSPTYDSLLRKDKQLETDIEQRKISLEDTVRTSYNQVMEQEKSYKKKQKDLKNANKELNNMKAKYKNGKLTKSDIDTQKLTIKKLENEIQNLIYEHYIEEMKLTNPKLLI